MRKAVVTLGAAVVLLGVQFVGVGAAQAQEVPVCGPPGEEVPATIVGAGTINGTDGDDVIVGSPGRDIIDAGNGQRHRVRRGRQ